MGYSIPSEYAMISSVDRSLFFLANQGMVNPLFDVLMPLLSERGFLLVFPVLMFTVIAAWQKRDAFLRHPTFLTLGTVLVPVAMFFLADGLNDLLKDHFARERPCLALGGVRLLIPCPRSFSMPSGHAIASFAFAASFFILTRGMLSIGWRLYPLILAGFIAFSRIYIGVHYPSDVGVGILCGIVLGGVVSAPLLRRYAPDDRRRAAIDEKGPIRFLRRNVQSGKVRKGRRRP